MDNFIHMIQSQDMSEKLSESKKHTWSAHGSHRAFYFYLSIILAWRIPGTEEPGGLPSMGSHRVGHD